MVFINRDGYAVHWRVLNEGALRSHYLEYDLT